MIHIMKNSTKDTHPVSIDLQHHTPLKARAHILRRPQRRESVPGIANNQHRPARADLKIALVALLGLQLPLRTGHIDAIGHAIHDAAHVGELLERRHQVLEGAGAGGAVGAVDANERLLHLNTGVVERVHVHLELADQEVDVFAAMDEHVEDSSEVGPGRCLVEAVGDSGGQDAAVDDPVADGDGVVLESLEEVPDGLFELLGGGAVAGEGALVGVLDAVLEDVGEFLVAVGPLFCVSGVVDKSV